jgi:hypothetical protein
VFVPFRIANLADRQNSVSAVRSLYFGRVEIWVGSTDRGMSALRYWGDDIEYNARGVHGTRLVYRRALEERIAAYFRGRPLRRCSDTHDVGAKCARHGKEDT